MSALRLCFVLALGQCLLAAVVGCSTVQRFTPREESKVRAAQLQELQLKVMRFADDYSGRISDPIVHLNIQTTPAEVRLRAHNWRVSQATAAYTIASGANPTINALDMIVLATLSRMVVEDRLLADYGERGRSLLDAHRSLEQQSWSLVDGVLNADQSKEVLAAIDRWRAENPTTRSVAQVRFADFAALELRRGTQQQQQGNNSLFGFIGLDPLSNLDPAVREIEQTRQLAERTIYYLQRAPGLLDMEVERLVYQLAAMPESEHTLTNIDRLSLAAEAIGTLSNRAPDIIASERQAIISQLTAALHTELRERGWAGSTQTVRRYVRPFRQALAAPDPAPAMPKTRQITRWLLTRPDHLQADEQAQLDAIRARCPHIDALAGHVTAFAQMMTARTGSRDLEAWLAAIEADDQAGLRSLAAGIRADQQAVTNGLTLPWNSGKVEGTVNKIKMIKRQMYGRAGFDLLRKRVILHPA